MVGVAIVAVPSQDSYVWKVSSEKIPHMTLLYFGDQDNNPKMQEIVQYVQHAAQNSLSRFGVQVDRRGTLGDDKADVLFLRPHEDGQIVAFRKNLLANPAIKEAYLSVDQYPQWTPHVTLGYPNAPAKPDEREEPGFDWIDFDKIMVWTEEFGGPEFLLKDSRNARTGELTMSELTDERSAKVGAFLEQYGVSQTKTDLTHVDDVEDFLAHYGVKGMKWGVRRSDHELAAARKRRGGGSGGGESRTRRIINKVTGRKSSGGSSGSEDGDSDSKSRSSGGGSSDEPKLSADAERAIKTIQKESSEMSTREIRETLERARLVKEYNKTFQPDTSNTLKDRVENLRLQKEYRNLQAELNPPKVSAVKKLVGASAAGYGAYKKLPGPIQEEISDQLMKSVGLKDSYVPKHRKK